MKLTKAKIIALQMRPIDIIKEMRQIIKRHNGYKFFRLKDGIGTVHKTVESVLNDTGKRVIRVTGNDNGFPCVVDRKGNVYQGPWAEVVVKLKTSGGK